MSQSSPIDDEAGIRLFQPLGAYEWPAMPTDESVRRFAAKVMAMLRRDEDEPVIASERLRKAKLKVLDDIVAPPACGPLLRELEATVAEKLSGASAMVGPLLLVLPPCDNNGIVEAWAREAGHEILPPPPRHDLIATAIPELPELDGPGVLVIPQLERWFLRHRNGLKLVRTLLAALDVLERPCIVGCNSWAWTFLCKAVGADLILPKGLAPSAFDAVRLHGWLSELARAELDKPLAFRMPETGEDVLAVDEDGRPKSDFFQTLAARSLGVPWVAWHQWRRSLRRDVPEEVPPASASSEADAASPAMSPEVDMSPELDKAPQLDKAPEEETFWIASLEELSLPGQHEQTALLVLHALLIHGTLTADELRAVLPIVGESNIVPALVAAGFVERLGNDVRCRPNAYPAIRNGLSSAGFSMDRL